MSYLLSFCVKPFGLPDEGIINAPSGTEIAVTGRIKRKGWMDCSAQIAACIADWAKIPKRPSRYRWCIGYTGGICFEEEYLVDWIAIDGTGQEDEEDQKTSSRNQDQRAKCKKWS